MLKLLVGGVAAMAVATAVVEAQAVQQQEVPYQ